MGEVNFVLLRCERIPLSVKTSASGKRVVWLAFDENIKKRNLLVLSKFNGKLIFLVSRLSSVINISKPDGWRSTLFSLEIAHENIGQNQSRGNTIDLVVVLTIKHKMAPLSDKNTLKGTAEASL